MAADRSPADSRSRRTDAAEALLAKGGVEALSVRGIAEAAGVTTRAVYSVFGGKEAMVGALYRRGCGRFLATLHTAPSADDPFENLMLLVRNGLRAFARKEPHLYRLIFERPLPGFSPTLQDRQELIAALEVLAKAMERVVAAGLAGGRDAQTLALEWTLTAQGIVSAELNLSPPGAEREALVEDILRSLFEGWRARPL